MNHLDNIVCLNVCDNYWDILRCLSDNVYQIYQIRHYLLKDFVGGQDFNILVGTAKVLSWSGSHGIRSVLLETHSYTRAHLA